MFEESNYEAGNMTADEAIESVLKRPELYGLCRVEERDSALARIARVEALHAKATIYELTAHYSPDESRPFQDYCIECTADSTIAMIEDCEWDSDWPVVSYPCPTVRALTEGEPSE